jgi:MoxR-like ATPase
MSEENVERFYNSYKKAGFHFPTSTLTTYSLSLCTKPFVLLSGVSGTGKTKIAQLFDVPSVSDDKVEAAKAIPKLSITVKRDFGRFNFHHDLLPELLEGSDLNEFNANAAEYAKRGDNGNFTRTYILTRAAARNPRFIVK